MPFVFLKNADFQHPSLTQSQTNLKKPGLFGQVALWNRPLSPTYIYTNTADSCCAHTDHLKYRTCQYNVNILMIFWTT